MSGDDAVVAVADILYQKISSDESMKRYTENVDLVRLSGNLRRVLGGVFDGEDWPEIHVNATMGLIDDCYEDLSGVVLDAVAQVDGNLALALETMAEEMTE